MKYILFAFSLSVSLTANSQLADVIFFKNNSTQTGSIVAINANTVTFKNNQGEVKEYTIASIDRLDKEEFVIDYASLRVDNVTYTPKENKASYISEKNTTTVKKVLVENTTTEKDEQVVTFPVQVTNTNVNVEGVITAQNKVIVTSPQKEQPFTENEFRQHFENNFNHDLAKNSGISGLQKIVMKFTIDSNGQLSNIETLALNSALEREATKVLKTLPISPTKQIGDFTTSSAYFMSYTFFVEK